MKTWKKLLGKFLSIVMVMSLFSGYNPVYASIENAYSDGAMSIVEYFDGGNLKTVISEFTTEYEEVTDLSISNGIVNVADFYFIRTELNNLTTLIIDGDALVDSDTDTSEYDNIIPSAALTQHDMLMYVEIPVAEEIGPQAFKEMLMLDEVSFENVTVLGEWGLAYNDSLTTVSMPNLQTIKTGGFDSAEMLESLSLPELVEIETFGLNDLIRLASFEAPKLSSVASSGLKNIAEEISAGIDLEFPLLSTISNAAFCDANINELIIENVDTIEDLAFDGATINQLYLGDIVPTVSSDDLFATGSPGKLIILDTVAEDYLTDTQDGDGTDDTWFGFEVDKTGTDPFLVSADIYVDGVLELSFDGNDTDLEVSVGYAVEDIQLDAAAYDDAVITVNDEAFDGSETYELSLGTNDFEIHITAEDGSTSTTSFQVTREEGETYTILDYFDGSTLEIVISGLTSDYDAITELTISNGIVNNEDFEFIRQSLSSLEVLIINEDAQVDSDTDTTEYDNVIASTALSGHDMLKYVEIPVAEEIGMNAFYDMDMLEEVSFENVTILWEMGLAYNTNLTTVSMPKLQTIKSSGLLSAENLETLSLPELLEVGNSGLSDLTSLTSFEAPNLSSVSMSSFDSLAEDVSGGIDLHLPSLTSVTNSAFDEANINELHIENAETIGALAFGAAQVNELYLGDTVPTVSSDDLIGIGVAGKVIVSDTAADAYLTDTQDGNGTDDTWFEFEVDAIGTDPFLVSADIYVDGALVQSFDGDDTDLEVSFGYGVEDIQLDATAYDDAVITVNDEAFDGSETYELSLGTNDFEIHITAEDGSTSTTSFQVMREEGETYTVDTSFDMGDLESYFDDLPMTDDEFLDYTSLTISVGTLDNTDLDFIMSHFLNLESLTVNGTATMENDFLYYPAFAGCDLVEVEMTNVKGIGDEVFHGCDNLTKAHFDAALEVGFSAFGECNDLTDVSFANAEFIDEEAFINDDNLTEFDFSGVYEIEEQAFYGTGLSSVYLANDVELCEEVFGNCEDLVTVSMPLVETIPSNAFIECESLESFSGDSVTTIEEGAFEYCTELTSLSIPNVEVINAYAFAQCGTLEEVYIPEVEDFGYEAFNNANSLTKMTLGSTIPTVGTNAFANLPNDRTVVVPAGYGDLYDADSGSDSDGYWNEFVIDEISDDATLASLEVVNQDLTTDFNSDVTAYECEVAYEVEDVEVIAVTTTDVLSITLNGKTYSSGDEYGLSLSVGSNVITIVIEAEDDETTETYTLTIDREEEVIDSDEDDDSKDDDESNDNNSNHNNSNHNNSNHNDSNDDGLIDLILPKSPSNPNEAGRPKPIVLDANRQKPIGEKVFKTLKESGKTLEIKGNGFTWSFDGSSEGEGKMNGDFDPGISFVKPDEVSKNIGKENAIVIRTNYDGELPFEAKLTLDVPHMGHHRPILLYYINESTDHLELAGRDENINGKVTFTLKHCSSYVIIDAPILVEDSQTMAYVSGYSDGTFKPEKALSRAEAAAMLDRLLESNGIQEDAGFSDTDMWAEECINNLAAIGIVSGYSDGTYKPDNTITRSELAILLTKALALDTSTTTENTFLSDIKGHWAKDAIMTLYNTGITTGYSDGSFKPDNVVTRIEAVTMINRALSRKNDESNDYNTYFSDVPKEHWGFYEAMNASGK